MKKKTRIFRRKYRIVKRYTPEFGGWFAIQKRYFFRWIDLARIFKTFDEAAYAIADYSVAGELKPMESVEANIEV